MGVCEGRWRSEQWRDRTNNASYYNNSINMGRIILCSTILLCLIVPTPAPFAKDDPRSFFNFLIEPWWCKVPKVVRQLLHLKAFGKDLVEPGECTTAPPPSSSAEPTPEGEPQPEGEPEPEVEPEPEAEPEMVPRSGRTGPAAPEPEPESVARNTRGSSVPEPEPKSRDPKNKVYFIQ